MDSNEKLVAMRLLVGMVTWGWAVAAAGVGLVGGGPRPMLDRAGGVPSLAQFLKQIPPGVVSIAIKGGTKPAANSPPGKSQGAQRAASTRDPPADGQMRATGSG